MKTTIATAFMTVLSTFAFGQETLTPTPTFSESIATKEAGIKKSFYYVRMGASPVAGVGVTPGLGVGYRLSSGPSAVDLSTTFTGRDTHSRAAYSYTFPKANYFYYLDPSADTSLYFGGGASWGGMYRDLDDASDFNFHGIIGNAAVGYEFHRTSTLRTFVQFDVNQPLINAVKGSGFPSPSAELGAGIGF